MSHLMQDIAVFFDDSDLGQSILETGAHLARDQNARLIGLASNEKNDATPEDGFARGEGIVDVIRRLESSSESHLLHASQSLANVAGRYGVTAEFRVIPYFGSDIEMQLSSFYSDLLLVGYPEALGTPFAWSSIKALQQTGVPILIVPRAWNGRAIARRITVAWNASRQARRAVADAFPLLLAAEAVDLLIVDPERRAERYGEDPGADMAAYLSRHGVQVNLRRASSQGRPVAETIVAHALEMNSDLIVFGAYSHSRISEAVLGGVSRTLLAEVPLPLFVSY